MSGGGVPRFARPATRVAAARESPPLPVLRGLARGRPLRAARGQEPERLAREGIR